MDNICESYCSQPFYMEYETLDGGKERYNDIIARYNSMRENKYEDYAKILMTVKMQFRQLIIQLRL